MHHGQPVRLGSRAFDVLLVLTQAGGALVSKDDLMQRAWPGLVVEEANVHVQISQLRKLLGADAIATVQGVTLLPLVSSTSFLSCAFFFKLIAK